jgi:muconolactone delta-isomerase
MNENRCFLYAMIADPGEGSYRYFKIGISSSVEGRIANIQIGCPMPIAQIMTVECRTKDMARACEQRMHSLLHSYRTSGEWFRFDMDDKTHKEAFHGAAKIALDYELLPGWKWELTDLDAFRQYKAETRPPQKVLDKRLLAAHTYRLAKGLPMW